MGNEKLLKIKLTREMLDAGEAAAIKVGYSPKNARRTAARLLRTPAVHEEILRRLREREQAKQRENT